jgi:hypothetical protein
VETRRAQSIGAHRSMWKSRSNPEVRVLMRPTSSPARSARSVPRKARHEPAPQILLLWIWRIPRSCDVAKRQDPIIEISSVRSSNMVSAYLSVGGLNRPVAGLRKSMSVGRLPACWPAKSRKHWTIVMIPPEVEGVDFDRSLQPPPGQWPAAPEHRSSALPVDARGGLQERLKDPVPGMLKYHFASNG